MKSIYCGIGLQLLAALSLQADMQTTVYPPDGNSPDFPGYTLQQILDSGVSTVKFAPGIYTIPVNYPPDFAPYGLLISRSVRLMAADKNNKPSLIVDNTTDPVWGPNVNGFTVIAPGAKVTIENLKFWVSGSWQNNCVNCTRFDLIGCEPADPPASIDGAIPWFGIACGPWGPPGVPCDVAKMNVVGNRLAGEDSVFTAAPLPASPGVGDLRIQGNTVHGSFCLDISWYRTLLVVDNDIVVDHYWYGVLAIGATICNTDPKSRAMIVNNRIHMDAPDPVIADPVYWPYLQAAVPFVLGGLYYDIPVYNAVVNNLTIDGPTPIPSLVETWQTHDCVIQNAKYGAANMLPAGTMYEYTTEALIRYYTAGKDDLYNAISTRDAAEYACLETDSLTVEDNNPSARLFEWPTPGVVYLLGRIAHTQP